MTNIDYVKSLTSANLARFLNKVFDSGRDTAIASMWGEKNCEFEYGEEWLNREHDKEDYNV